MGESSEGQLAISVSKKASAAMASQSASLDVKPGTYRCILGVR